MLAAERHERIVQVVNERGSVRVTELSKLFQVTEETIRKDLDQLESAVKLRRSHGGAMSIREEQPETPYFEREIMNVEEKKNIAQEAIKYINQGDRIILDASTTAWYMSSILPNIKLTVLTNSIKVALELSSKENVEVISTGGSLNSRSLSYIGPLAERSLEQYHVNKTFISCKGVHLKRGISEPNELEARLKQKMIDVADEVFLLVDSSKFGIQAFTHVAPCTEIDVVITDKNADNEVVKSLFESNIKVIRLTE